MKPVHARRFSLDTTPPPPAKRGAIRAACKQNEMRSVPLATTGLHAKIERALKPAARVRTTLRVDDGSKRSSWAEVTERQSHDHYSIIKEIQTAIVAGQVTTKEEAVAMKQRLLGM